MKMLYKSRRGILCPCILGVVLILFLSPDVYSRSAPENGAVREYYPNGRIHLEFRYKSGYLIRERYWYKNGRLMADYKYRKGEPVKKLDYYENGRIKSVWSRKTGILKYYFPDGRLKAEIDSRSDGIF